MARSSMRVLALLSVASFPLVACTSPAPGPQRSASITLPALGTAETFAVVGGQAVTNTGPTTVLGNLGVSPGLAVTGFPPGMVSGGVIHAGDPVALQAQADITTAYNSVAGLACDHDLTGQDLGGQTLTPGVYCFSSSAQLTGALTLNAEGNPDAVFAFQIGSTLTTASNASVITTNGAQSCNTVWQVGSSAALGTTTTFVGNILALTSITLATGAQVDGRALARNGAVTMDNNHVEMATCTTDAGAVDAGDQDATVDTGTDDVGAGGASGDAGPNDGAPVLDSAESDAADAGATDTGTPDTGTPDTGTPDTGAPDADAGVICCVGVACGTTCVDLSVDSDNCGACGNSCAPSEQCSGGFCVTCTAVCEGSCADLAWDRNNCGVCANTCLADQICNAGTCTTCESECGGSCAYLEDDRKNCGACGNVCSADEWCSAGACVLCDDTICDGACANLQTDSANCGECGNDCGLGASCVNWICICL